MMVMKRRSKKKRPVRSGTALGGRGSGGGTWAAAHNTTSFAECHDDPI